MDSTKSGRRNQTIVSTPKTIGETILEIRRLSGLTWEQLSELFGVSQRTLTHWTNGKPPSDKHERHIRKASYLMHRLYRGSQQTTRDYLLKNDDGESLFVLLAEHQYDRIILQVHEVDTYSSLVRRTTQSEDKLNRDTPTRPVHLLDAIQSRPESPVGNVRIVYPLGCDEAKFPSRC